MEEAVNSNDRRSLAIIGLITGVVGLAAWLIPICGVPVAILTLVLGFLSRRSSRHTLAIAVMIIGAVGLVLAVGNAVIGVYLGMASRLGGSPNSTTMKDQLQAVETTGFAQRFPNLVVTDVTVEFDGAGRLLPQDRSSGVTMLTCYQAFIDYTTADGSCQGGEVHHGMLALIDGQWSYDMYAQIDFDTWAGHECGDFTMRPPQWCLTATRPTNHPATPGEPSTEFSMQDATAYFDRGFDHYKQGNLEAAIEDYTKAIELDPQYVLAYYDRGGARSEQGNFDAAIEDYTKAIALDPQAASVYCNRGLARYAQGDLTGAIADYRQYLDLSPDAADRQEIEQWIAKLEKQLSNP